MALGPQRNSKEDAHDTEQQRTTMEYTQRNSKEDVNTLTKKYEPNGYGATVNKEQQTEPNQ